MYDKKYTIKKNQFRTRYKHFIMELFISGKHSVDLIKREREKELQRHNRNLIFEFYKIYFLMKRDCYREFSTFSQLCFNAKL